MIIMIISMSTVIITPFGPAIMGALSLISDSSKRMREGLTIARFPQRDITKNMKLKGRLFEDMSTRMTPPQAIQNITTITLNHLTPTLYAVTAA